MNIGLPEILFDLNDAQQAANTWRFNCGPGALCAVLGMRPEELRQHMGDFERKGYTNPTLMFDVLKRLKVPHELVYRGDKPHGAIGPMMCCPPFGLIRVQWSGPWTKPEVPMAARYRHTHWIARRRNAAGGTEIFDVNATCAGGWISWKEWSGQVVPWLLKEVVPKSDGTWWVTHAIAIPNLNMNFPVTGSDRGPDFQQQELRASAPLREASKLPGVGK